MPVRRSSVLVISALCLLLTPAARRPLLYRIDLQPTDVGGGARAVARLTMASSPFGISLTPDGHFLYDVDLRATGLRPASTRGAYTTYVAWATDDNLSAVKRLGEVRDGQPITGQVDYNKFILLITAERTAGGTHWQGPVVLRGLSASMYLDNFSGKTFFNNGVPQ